MNVADIIETTVTTDFKGILLRKSELSAIEKKLEEVPDQRIYPAKERTFAAFQYFNIADTKIVILGMDPYHTKDVANGLAFSVNEGKKAPPSLVNIFKEIETEYRDGVLDKRDGNLERWAEQGILLMNSALTVQEGKRYFISQSELL